MIEEKEKYILENENQDEKLEKAEDDEIGQKRKNKNICSFISWDEYFMGIAFLSSMRSKDPSTQVGACIVSPFPKNYIVGIGYNGFPRGCADDALPWCKDSADPLENKYMYVCHAEVNAVLNTNNTNLNESRMYVSLFPCNECAKVIIQSGIKEIIYAEDKYHDSFSNIAARRMFALAGIQCRHFPFSFSFVKVEEKEYSTNIL